MHNNSAHIWKKLKEYPAGKRFELLFEHRRTQRASLLKRFLFIVGGFLLLIMGFMTLPTPIPGVILLLIGASLIAQESLMAARILDWAELRFLALGTSINNFWKRLHISLKIILTFSLVCLLGLVGTRVLLVFLA